jgi:hypothetical protein
VNLLLREVWGAYGYWRIVFFKEYYYVLWICAKLDVATSGPCSVHLTEMGTLSLLLVIVSLFFLRELFLYC